MQIGPRIGARVSSRIGMTSPVSLVFVGASDATFEIPDDSVELTVSTPDGVALGDTMLIFAVTDAGGSAEPTSLPSGWTQIAAMHSDAEIVLFVFRKIATGSEPSTHAVQLAGGALHVGAMLVAYRGLNTSAALVASAITDCDPSGLPTTNFPCPSLTLAAATDLYIGIAWVDGAPSLTTPGGTTTRFDEYQASNPGEPGVARLLDVFDFHAVASGATGTKTSTISSAHVGIAASIALVALG